MNTEKLYKGCDRWAPRQVTILCLLLSLLIPGGLPAAESPPELEHKQAVEQARQGEFDDASKRLNALVQAYPEQPEFFYDYITVLAWAGRDVLALEQLSKVALDQAPTYTLEAVAKAARNQKRFDLAAATYQLALGREPQRKQARLGLSLSLADAGKADDALSVLRALLAKQPAPIDALEVQAYIETSRADHVEALKIYDRVLARQADHRGAMRGRIMATVKMGAPHQAAEMAAKHPTVLTRQDWRFLKGEQAATTLRWGRLHTTDPAQRYQETDKAIAMLEQQLAGYDSTDSSAALRTRLDLLAAYRERRQMKKAVAEYEHLREKNIVFPPYALVAAADAFLYLRQPATAAELLEKALAQEPYDFEAGVLLLYAYVENEDFDSALQHVDQLIHKQAGWFRPPGALEDQPNPERLHANIIAAVARAYAGNPAEAQRRLDRLMQQAPHNTDLRNELANVYLFRGWPRQALGEFQAVLAVEKDHLGAQAGRVEALAQTGDLSAADAGLVPLLETYGDEQRIINLKRHQQTRNLREFWLALNGGSNTSTFEGSSDLSLEAYLYDTPLTPTLRPYLHGLHQQASFDGDTTGYDRIGVGLHYQARDNDLHAEIDMGDGNAGLSVQARHMFNDQLSLAAGLDSYSDELPLQARLADIDAWSANLGLDYRFHESREVGVEYQHLNFSDNNRRENLSAYARQRLFSTPTYQLDASLNYFYQQNSVRIGPYFNPVEQNALELALANDWLTHRHYEHAFRQRLVLSAGVTNQLGYGSDKHWVLAYEHHWDLSDRLSVAYGIDRSRAIYDGSPEYATRGFLNLYTRF